MQLVPSDILTEFCNLSRPLLITLLVVGLALWLFGWRMHRFWVVMGTTVIAGVYGLMEGQGLQTYPLVAGVVLAVAAGILALSVIRLVAFFLGGAIGFVIIQSQLPAFNQPLVSFVACGFLGLLLFRWWFMALTSASGTMLIALSAIALVQRNSASVLPWVDKNAKLVSWGGIALAGIGLIFQAFFEWRRLRKQGRSTVVEEIEDPAKVLLSFPNPLKVLWKLRKAG